MALRWTPQYANGWQHGYAGRILVAHVSGEGRLVWARKSIRATRDRDYVSRRAAITAAERRWARFLREAGLRETGDA
jgi:hypothetical protein